MKKHKWTTKLKIACVISAALLMTGIGFAALNAVGPVNAVNGYPAYYQDSNGLAVQLGNGDGTFDPVLDIFDPPIDGNAFSQQIGFGAEAFYFLAEASLDIPASPALPTGGGAIIVLALEAAFAAEDPVDGDQFPFARVRIRVDAPLAGTYTVTHPYGVDVFEVETPGVKAINFTEDIGTFAPDFTGALRGRIGPFLIAENPAPPAGRLGNPAILQTVTGSRFGTNFFRIKGPGGFDIQTDQFLLTGKIFTGVVPTPLQVERATYKRTDSADIDVFATSTPTSSVSFSGDGIPSTPMTGDANGRFFNRVRIADGNLLPTVVTVTASNPPNADSSIIRNLSDQVFITKAEYDFSIGRLEVQAVSSDEGVVPVLTAVGLGDLTAGTLILNGLASTPARITVISSAGGSSTQDITIVSRAPFASGDAYTVDEDTPLNIAAPGVLANDFDEQSDPLTAVLEAGVSNGSLTLNSNGSFTYTPSADFNGTDSFTYRANDGALNSKIAQVLITVNPVNDAPVAAADAVSGKSGGQTIVDVLANDTDVDNILLVVTNLTSGANGATSVNPDGTVTYVSNPGFTGTDTFSYTANDGIADSQPVNVTVTVTPNSVPVTVADSYSVNEDSVLTVNAPGILANDVDGDADPLTAVLVSGVTNGALTLNSNGSFTYTPSANFNGSDSFIYRANDGAVSGFSAQVSITVTSVNDVPIAGNDAGSGRTGTSIIIDVLANDTDIENSPLSVTSLTNGLRGTTVVSPDGTVSYTPSDGFIGGDTFTYRANDGEAESNVATVNVTVLGPNRRPAARSDIARTSPNTPVTINVIANDVDSDGTINPATVVITRPPLRGGAVANGDGTITYTPPAGFSGSDSFRYTVQDNEGAVSGEATVFVIIL